MPYMMRRFVGWPGRHVPAPDTAAQAPGTELGPLPAWDLADLYPGTDAPRLGADLAALEVDAVAFRGRYASMLAALSGVRNVVVLTTDTHAHLIGEIRTQTFAPGGPVGTGIWEVVTGPVATNTYAKEIDDVLGSSGFGAVVTGAFFKPQPPNGLGLRCAQTDTYGYAQVTVTRTTLRVAPKTASGAAVRDVTGAPCAPLVVTAR